MLTKTHYLEQIRATGSFLIIRLEDEDDAYQVAKAAIRGGMRALEVTYSVPGALRVVEQLTKEHADDGILIGVGTVIDAQSAYAAIEAGARMLVSPHVSPEMIATANRYQAVSICGAFTPTEMFTAVELGADIVKLFPADAVGPAYVKNVLAPFPQIPIAPTGGVSPETVQAWFDAGVAACGIGSYITKAAQGTGDYSLVTEATARFLQAVAAARPQRPESH
jgi:2-dehydro-3-deoxyphosphogluconate aldolase / (4S)-4-hydroxy-2-oxoglutarate aldolase